MLLTHELPFVNGDARWCSYSLRMLPSTHVCPSVTPGCWRYCYGWSGPQFEKRKKVQSLYLNYYPRFLEELYRALDEIEGRVWVTGELPAVQLNWSSDIPWERDEPSLFERYPDIMFWDETRDQTRLRGPLPRNYDLTLARDGRLFSENPPHRLSFVVRNQDALTYYMAKPGRPVWRAHVGRHLFLAPKDALVYRLAKGRARHDTLGFVLDKPEHEG